MGRHTIGCHCGTYWPIGMEKAIEKSCNNYFSSVFIKSPKNTLKGRNRAIDEWKEIMNSFGLGEFMNNDLAVGAKEKFLLENFIPKD